MRGHHAAATHRIPTYYVATNGNNAWTGLLPTPNIGNTDGPFLTLAAAQTATHSGSIKRVTVRAGTYTLGANLAFTSADNGCTWCRYGSEVAIIDGATSVYKVVATSVTNLTIKGLVFQNLLGSNASGSGALRFTTCTGLVFRWNTVQNITTGWMVQNWGSTNSLIDSNTFSGQSPGNFAGTANAYAAVQVASGSGSGSGGTTVSHNSFTNLAGGAISAETATGAPRQDNIIFDRNLCNGCCNSVVDMGALYMYDQNGTATGCKITNNTITNNGTGHNGPQVRGIYLDEGMSNVEISKNLLYNKIGVITIQLAHFVTAAVVNNVASNNVIAISTLIDDNPPQNDWYNIETHGYQGGNTGNQFTRNIVYYYTTSHSPPWTTFNLVPTAYPSSSNNMYFSATGQTLFNNGNVVDSSPDNKNPLFVNAAAGNFALQGTSPAYADLSWVDLPTDQGPLPYVAA